MIPNQVIVSLVPLHRINIKYGGLDADREWKQTAIVIDLFTYRV